MRTNLWTVIAVGIVAYAACDMVHEVLGHGVACALTGGHAISLSTVALQTESESRIVAAAGSVANVIAGLLSLLAFRRGSRFSPSRLFLWVFASTNLLNGTGYLLFSGILDYGDWAVVIAGLEPHWVWRVLLAVAGAVTYVGVVRLIAAEMVRLVRSGDVSRREVGALVFPAYVAGGLLFVAGSALNPIGPSLILLSGVSSGFGAMAGLAYVPKLVEVRTGEVENAAVPLGLSLGWVIAGLLVAAVFVAVFGPGVRFSYGTYHTPGTSLFVRAM